jgi:hypothetical protein
VSVFATERAHATGARPIRDVRLAAVGKVAVTVCEARRARTHAFAVQTLRSSVGILASRLAASAVADDASAVVARVGIEPRRQEFEADTPASRKENSGYSAPSDATEGGAVAEEKPRHALNHRSFRACAAAPRVGPRRTPLPCATPVVRLLTTVRSQSTRLAYGEPPHTRKGGRSASGDANGTREGSRE